jgi:hypothetical protein
VNPDGPGHGHSYATAERTAEPLRPANLTDTVVEMVGWSPLVHQAIGMVAVQLDCDVIQAASRLVEHARVTNQQLPEAARDVLTRRKNFA